MRFIKIFILLLIFLNCYDPRMTPRGCREKLERNVKFVLISEPMVRENIRDRHPNLTDEEVEREVQRRMTWGLMWMAVMPYLECMGDTLDCSNIGDLMSRPDECIEEITK